MYVYMQVQKAHLAYKFLGKTTLVPGQGISIPPVTANDKAIKYYAMAKRTVGSTIFPIHKVIHVYSCILSGMQAS